MHESRKQVLQVNTSPLLFKYILGFHPKILSRNLQGMKPNPKIPYAPTRSRNPSDSKREREIKYIRRPRERPSSPTFSSQE